MEFFKIKHDIPFMSYGRYTTSISLVTFLLAVFFLATIFNGYLAQALFPQENLRYAIDLYWVFQTFVRMFVLSLGIISLQMMLSVIIPGFVWPFVIGFVGFVGLRRLTSNDFLKNQSS